MKRWWKIFCARVRCNGYLLRQMGHGQFEQELNIYDEKSRVVLVAAIKGPVGAQDITKIFYQV